MAGHVFAGVRQTVVWYVPGRRDTNWPSSGSLRQRQTHFFVAVSLALSPLRTFTPATAVPTVRPGLRYKLQVWRSGCDVRATRFLPCHLRVCGWNTRGWCDGSLYRVIHKFLRDFRTLLRNNQDRHGRKEHISR